MARALYVGSGESLRATAAAVVSGNSARGLYAPGPPSYGLHLFPVQVLCSHWNDKLKGVSAQVCGTHGHYCKVHNQARLWRSPAAQGC